PAEQSCKHTPPYSDFGFSNTQKLQRSDLPSIEIDKSPVVTMASLRGHLLVSWVNTRRMKLTKKESDFIKSQNVARIATVSGDGMPHNVPVCPVLDGGKIYFGTEKNARKVKNIEADSQVAIVFDVYHDSWKNIRGVLMQCDGRIVDSAQFKKARRK